MYQGRLFWVLQMFALMCILTCIKMRPDKLAATCFSRCCYYVVNRLDLAIAS